MSTAFVATLVSGPVAAFCVLAESEAKLATIENAALPEKLTGISVKDGEPPVPPHVTAARLVDRVSGGCSEAVPTSACRASAVAAVSRQVAAEIRATIGRGVPPFRRMVLRAASLCLKQLEAEVAGGDLLTDRMAVATIDAVAVEIERRLAAVGAERVTNDTEEAFKAVVEIAPGERVAKFVCAGARFGLEAGTYNCAKGPAAGVKSLAALSEKLNATSGALLDQSVSDVGKRLEARAEASTALDKGCASFGAGRASYRSLDADWQSVWNDDVCNSLEAGGLTEPRPAEPPANWSFLADWLDNKGRKAVSPEAALAFLALPARAEARREALDGAATDELAAAEIFRAGVCRLHRLFIERPELFEDGPGAGAMSDDQFARALSLMKKVPAEQCDGDQ